MSAKLNAALYPSKRFNWNRSRVGCQKLDYFNDVKYFGFKLMALFEGSIVIMLLGENVIHCMHCVMLIL